MSDSPALKGLLAMRDGLKPGVAIWGLIHAMPSEQRHATVKALRSALGGMSFTLWLNHRIRARADILALLDRAIAAERGQ